MEEIRRCRRWTQMGKIGLTTEARSHGGREEGADRRGAQSYAEVRRWGRGTALRAGCLGKRGLESRLRRAFHPLFPKTTAQPSRRAAPSPSGFPEIELRYRLETSDLSHLCNLRMSAYGLISVYLCGLCGCILFACEKGEIAKQSHLAPRGYTPLWRFAGLATLVLRLRCYPGSRRKRRRD